MERGSDSFVSNLILEDDRQNKSLNSDVLELLQSIREKERYVLSIAGAQCKGKSTFANAAYNFDFPVRVNSFGRTSKGIGITFNEDLIFLDVEGSSSNERSREGCPEFEYITGAFSLYVSDVFIFNVLASDIDSRATTDYLSQIIAYYFKASGEMVQNKRILILIRDIQIGSIIEYLRSDLDTIFFMLYQDIINEVRKLVGDRFSFQKIMNTISYEYTACCELNRDSPNRITSIEMVKDKISRCLLRSGNPRETKTSFPFWSDKWNKIQEIVESEVINKLWGSLYTQVKPRIAEIKGKSNVDSRTMEEFDEIWRDFASNIDNLNRNNTVIKHLYEGLYFEMLRENIIWSKNQIRDDIQKYFSNTLLQNNFSIDFISICKRVNTYDKDSYRFSKTNYTKFVTDQLNKDNQVENRFLNSLTLIINETKSKIVDRLTAIEPYINECFMNMYERYNSITKECLEHLWDEITKQIVRYVVSSIKSSPAVVLQDGSLSREVVWNELTEEYRKRILRNPDSLFNIDHSIKIDNFIETIKNLR
jgi:hypothetical protein